MEAAAWGGRGRRRLLLAAALPACGALHAASYPVVDSGQTNCYSTSAVLAPPAAGQPFYGQDAQVFGNQSAYVVSGDGKTVYDQNTGRTWMRGPNTNLAPPVRSDKMTLPAAQTWVTNLNAAGYGGYNDWRLPSVKELYSLFDCRGTDPSSYAGTDTSVLTPFIDASAFNFAWGQTSLADPSAPAPQRFYRVDVHLP